VNRLETGIADLDLILGGGFPSGSLVVLAGGPGTGKTILAQQLCFAVGTSSRRATYYTTISEPHAKLIRHLEPFSFYDRTAIGTRVEYLHLGDLLAENGAADLRQMVDEIVRASAANNPALVVLDSTKALRDFVDPRLVRKAVYDLAAQVADTGVVLMLVGEYTAAEIEALPEFALADVILQLAYEPREPADRRWLRVVKLRGARHLDGKHAFRIWEQGIEVFPRLEALPPATQPQINPSRVSSGLPKLDEMMGGGLHAADTTALLGPTGCGKTALALRFTAEGVRSGERAVYVSFQETQEQLLAKATSFGWNLTAAVESDSLHIHHIPHGELNLDALGAIVRRELAAGGVRRVVIDSLAELVLAARETDRFPAYSRMLTGLVRAAGAALLITSETQVLGPNLEPLGGLSFLFQNVIMLRYVELQSELRRAVNVLKMRDSNHAKGLVQFDIMSDGPRIMDRLEGVTGVLGWTALHVDAPSD
jgi:circadian clock protein KaiC